MREKTEQVVCVTLLHDVATPSHSFKRESAQHAPLINNLAYVRCPVLAPFVRDGGG